MKYSEDYVSPGTRRRRWMLSLMLAAAPILPALNATEPTRIAAPKAFPMRLPAVWRASPSFVKQPIAVVSQPAKVVSQPLSTVDPLELKPAVTAPPVEELTAPAPAPTTASEPAPAPTAAPAPSAPSAAAAETPPSKPADTPPSKVADTPPIEASETQVAPTSSGDQDESTAPVKSQALLSAPTEDEPPEALAETYTTIEQAPEITDDSDEIPTEWLRPSAPLQAKLASERRPQADEPTVSLASTRLAAVQGYRQQRAQQQQAAERPQPTRWLRSTTSSATSELAKELIAQSKEEYRAKAWLSAEASAWEALQWAAESVQLNHRESHSSPGDTPIRAVDRLKLARQIIYEARDFSGKYGMLDGEAIARMARSHVADVLDHQSTAGLTATDAADLYLDEARVLLAPIAIRSVEAAQAMDLLAAIYLSRRDEHTLPSATAICLRRAALQGQPKNASLASKLGMHLADVGLYDEARWALERANSLAPTAESTEALVNVLQRGGHEVEATRLAAALNRDNQRQRQQPTATPDRRMPEVVQLSPEQFAAMSRPGVRTAQRPNRPPAQPAAIPPATNQSRSIPARPVSSKLNVSQVPYQPAATRGSGQLRPAPNASPRSAQLQPTARKPPRIIGPGIGVERAVQLKPPPAPKRRTGIAPQGVSVTRVPVPKLAPAPPVRNQPRQSSARPSANAPNPQLRLHNGEVPYGQYEQQGMFGRFFKGLWQ